MNAISILRFVNSICNLRVLLYYERLISFFTFFFSVMAADIVWSLIGCAINFMAHLLIFRNNSNLLHGYHYFSQKRTYIIEKEMARAIATGTIVANS